MSMLPRTSNFVLEVLPFVLSGLIAIFIVFGSLHSWARGSNNGPYGTPHFETSTADT